MKRLVLALAAAPLLAPSAWSDVIYSGYQNIAVPQNFEGVYLNLGTGASSGSYPGDVSWDSAPWINPFFGGVDIGTSPLLRPVVSSLGGLNGDPIRNLSVGTLVNNASVFTPAHNGSETHVGAGAGQFTLGTAGNIGFQFQASVGGPINYGSLNTTISNSGAGVIRDWAYDNAGGAIVVGRVQQSAPSGGEQTFTLSPGTGESFTLGSAITDTGGNINSLIKTGAGTTTLGTASSYTGGTFVNNGILLVNNTTGSGTGTGAVTVNDGGTLGGTGIIGGTLTVKSGGTHAPGNSPGIQTISGNTTYESGSIFAWDLNSNAIGTRGTNYDGVTVTGNLTVESGAIFRVIQNAGLDFANTFWTTNQTWSDIFSVSGSLTGWATNTLVAVYDTTNTLQNVSSYGSFTISGSTLSWSAVPEPSTALAGLLLAAGLLHRRRN